jgi:murein DD-endopeptidase MepM/ murein hydrolase activator NlpD
MKLYQKIGLWLTGILATAWLIKEAFVRTNYKPTVAKEGVFSFGNPLVPMKDRGTDVWGNGGFGAIRTGHIHEGSDYHCEVGQPVYSPFEGTFDRVAFPYRNDKRWKGGLLKSKDGVYEIKIFYFEPLLDIVGKNISKGELIGKCQDLSVKYPNIGNHIHVEVRENDKLVNPEYFFSTIK